MEILIESILKEIGIDFDIDEYEGNSNTYIVYSVLDMSEKDYSDNTANVEQYFITVHYWTKDLTKISFWENIKDTFKSKGFKFTTCKRGVDSKYKGKLMHFIYEKNI